MEKSEFFVKLFASTAIMGLPLGLVSAAIFRSPYLFVGSLGISVISIGLMIIVMIWTL